ncbi:MAG: hypothetical protein M3290_06670 [Actinomycetota bacterium]|nr:hypothetical protein [Actinomycetota bacterium]
MTRRGRRHRRTLSGVVALGLLISPLIALGDGTAAHAASCQVPGHIRSVGKWVLVAKPRFKVGPQRITSFAVDPYRANYEYATNGSVVMTSVNGGCTWLPSFVLPEAPDQKYQYSRSNATIKSIVVPHSGGASNNVYLLIAETDAGVVRPHVVVSRDSGQSWTASDTGLPPVGDPAALHVAQTPPTNVFIGIDTGGGALYAIYASTDSGATWTLRSGPTDLTPQRGIRDFAIDPIDASQLWGWGNGGLFHSSDGGATFAAVPEFSATPVSTADVFHEPGHLARVIAFRPTHKDYERSDDGGKKWLKYDLPTGATVTSIAHGASSDAIVISAGGAVYGYYSSAFAFIPLKAPVGGVIDLVPTEESFYGHNASFIVAYGSSGPSVQVPTQLALQLPFVQPVNVSPPVPPSLAPSNRRIVLKPGQSRHLPYVVNLPKRPLPLDVFFLLDTSSSMRKTLAAMLTQTVRIEQGLAATGVDLHIGVGSFRSYPDAFPPRQNEPEYVYHRDLDIEPPSGALISALKQLAPEGGGRYDAQLGALYQMATGEGQDLYPPGPLGHDVPPGLQADFRRNSLRVAVVATDENFGHSFESPDPADVQPPPHIPSWDEVLNALNAKDIHAIGIATQPKSVPDLTHLAAGTGTVAPAGGVDCDGNGTADVAAGAPIMCRLTRDQLDESTGLADAITESLKAIRTTAGVDFAARGSAKVIDGVNPAAYTNVVLQSSHSLHFQVGVHCPLGSGGQTFPISVNAHTPANDMSSHLTLVCKKLPHNRSLPAVLAGLAAAPLPVLALPPPPPPPITSVSSSTQSQSQVQANVGTAAQEQEQPQAAFAAAYDAYQEQQQYAMSSYRAPRQSFPVGAAAIFGAAFVALAWACVRVVSETVLASQRHRR